MVAAALLTVGATALPASAADLFPPTASISFGTGDSSTLRAVLGEHYDGGGYQMRIYGGGECTSSTDTYDARFSSSYFSGSSQK